VSPAKNRHPPLGNLCVNALISSTTEIRCATRADGARMGSMSPTKNHILILLSESEKTSFGKEDFFRQSVPQRVFSAIWAVESEVNNGGFSQYFLNSTGDSTWFVVQALETVGAPKTADICKRAIKTAFPSGLPESEDAIRSAAASFPDQVLAALGPLDQEFFSYPHNLANLLFSYVSRHPQEFGELPKADDA
jgi:Domain of unknown function (DUF4375)